MRTWAIAASHKASLPGRISRCSSANSAVRVRIGSTTTMRPPRLRKALNRPGKLGAVSIEPLETRGLAPKTRNKSVRSMSANAIDSAVPYIIAEAACFGIWSTVLAEKRCDVPKDLIKVGSMNAPDRECTFGLPRNKPTESGPEVLMTSPRRVRITEKASSQVAGTNAPCESRTRGVRNRVGSVSTAPSETPLGQMNPWLNTSVLSPRTDVTVDPVISSSRPQFASQRGQMRNAVRSESGFMDASLPSQASLRP